MQKINLIQLASCPIYKQLELEEALLRSHDQNFCLINRGSSQEAIVMGISSKVKEHLNVEKVKVQQVPVIRRFSGGGTVYVDHNTLFVTFIINKESLPIPLFPEPILKWSERFYRSVFKGTNFALRENDYVFGELKFGGNAKYIRKDRWLLHTSFLWDYSQEKMTLLQNPEKAPNYRKKREHQDFLTPLKKHVKSQEELIVRIQEALKLHFKIDQVYEDYPDFFLDTEHRKSTQFIELD